MAHCATHAVPCLTPDAFLAREGLKAADIDMLGVDTEGADLEIISAWLQVPFFNPIVISYESKNNVWSEKVPTLVGYKSTAVVGREGKGREGGGVYLVALGPTRRRHPDDGGRFDHDHTHAQHPWRSPPTTAAPPAQGPPFLLRAALTRSPDSSLSSLA